MDVIRNDEFITFHYSDFFLVGFCCCVDTYKTYVLSRFPGFFFLWCFLIRFWFTGIPITVNISRVFSCIWVCVCFSALLDWSNCTISTINPVCTVCILLLQACNGLRWLCCVPFVKIVCCQWSHYFKIGQKIADTGVHELNTGCVDTHPHTRTRTYRKVETQAHTHTQSYRRWYIFVCDAYKGMSIILKYALHTGSQRTETWKRKKNIWRSKFVDLEENLVV